MNDTSSMASAVSAGRVSVKPPFMSVDMPRVCPASVTRTVAPITGAPFSSLTTPFTVWLWGVLDEDDSPVLETTRAVGQHLPHHLGHGFAHGRDGDDPLEVEVAVIVEKRVIGQSLDLFQNLFDRDVVLGDAYRGGGSLRPSTHGQ